MSPFPHAQVDAALAAQLRPQDMPALVSVGFRGVINNCPDSEGGPGKPTTAELEAAARREGLEYRYLPVPPANHTTEQASSMVSAIRALPQPVLALCRSGRRSAALYRLGKGAP